MHSDRCDGAGFDYYHTNGETVAANITESDLKKEFPTIYNRIKTGLAGNDATLRINFAKDLLRGMR